MAVSHLHLGRSVFPLNLVSFRLAVEFELVPWPQSLRRTDPASLVLAHWMGLWPPHPLTLETSYSAS